MLRSLVQKRYRAGGPVYENLRSGCGAQLAHFDKRRNKEGKHMFGKITELGHVRSITEAIGFFLFYTVLLVGLSTFLGHYLGVLGIIDGTTVGSFFEGGHVNTLIGAGWVLMVSGLILTKRGLTGDLMSVLIALAGVYLAYTVSVMGGMILVSYLTTLDRK